MTAPGGPDPEEPGRDAEPDPVDLEILAANASADRALADVQSDAASSPEQPPVDLTAAAFFDVDNTLVQGSSLLHFGRGLAARKYFTYRDVLGFVYAQAKFQLIGRENSNDVAEGRRKALAFIEGRSTGELMKLGEEIFDEIIADKIWDGTRDLAQMHLDAGQQVWLVTATPYELAITIARRLGLTGALGTVAESVDGIFTGRLVGEILHGPAKLTPSARWPSARASTSSAAPLTPTATTTYRCSPWLARPWPSTRTPRCATWPASAAGRSATSGRRERPPASACRRPWHWGRPAAHWPRSPLDGNHADKLRR